VAGQKNGGPRAAHVEQPHRAVEVACRHRSAIGREGKRRRPGGGACSRRMSD
jgi:hypothetical protein